MSKPILIEKAWIVGRGDGGCFVDFSLPQNGDKAFLREAEALRYAIMCEEDAIAPLRRNLIHLRARLRKAERRS